MRRSLAPVARVTYVRRAYFGSADDKPVRLTFDRRIRGGLTNGWSLEAPSDERDLLCDKVICEFKFRDALPMLFKNVITDLQLLPQGVSKYRHCVTACGGPPQESQADA